MDQLRAIRYFNKVVETGSFTKAAKVFNVPSSSLSRRVADLEKSLGATLLKRSTRIVKLTEVGQIYYNDMQQILNQLEQSNETVRSYQTTPMGRLRISSMVGFGEKILLPLLDEFSQLYPEIILDVSLSDELSTLGRDDVDIAIRGGYAPNERVLAIRLMDNGFIPVASPRYLEKYGVPMNAMELQHHKGLYFKAPLGPTPWLCNMNGQWHDVSGPAVAISNNGPWLAKKACNGEGILMSTRWALASYLESGKLQELTFEHELTITQSAEMAVYLLYQKHRYLVPKVKAAVDFLVQKIKVTNES
ncbi:LysR substrate-binding domain-containing protein [Pseudoalteromonas sp. 20-92]|uniref:LysR family transcriptional regulator n=1 Tax=Pseudoalteromonas sp. 20-92 TaxID=2969394 RepID=UPI0027B4F3BE|nr:LysR family transcriptional regulator [Pseudoalteromonas sp. 20-92]MDQ2045785.1 LysR substrate-binding domain-containing protein [Pseudoalteromonas sp. 20-92]